MAPRSRGLRLTSPYACVGPTTPRPQGPRFGLYPFRSPLLGASRLISLSSGYLDVSVPRVCSPCGVTVITDGRVSPFGHLGISACVPLPQAYRSLPRPSSPLCAQASSTCYRSLDYKSVTSIAISWETVLFRRLFDPCIQAEHAHNSPNRTQTRPRCFQLFLHE